MKSNRYFYDGSPKLIKEVVREDAADGDEEADDDADEEVGDNTPVGQSSRRLSMCYYNTYSTATAY